MELKITRKNTNRYFFIFLCNFSSIKNLDNIMFFFEI